MRWLGIDTIAINDVDYTVAETFRSLCGILKKKIYAWLVPSYWWTIKPEAARIFIVGSIKTYLTTWWRMS